LFRFKLGLRRPAAFLFAGQGSALFPLRRPACHARKCRCVKIGRQQHKRQQQRQ
jgi:hypothetical protein